MEENFATDLNISANVIETILARTVEGIDGVMSLSKKTRKQAPLNVENTEEGVIVDVHIIVVYGEKIAEIAANVRAAVALTIEEQVGVPVVAVNVFVEDIVFPE